MKVLVNGKDFEKLQKLEELRMEHIAEVFGWLGGLFTRRIKKQPLKWLEIGHIDVDDLTTSYAQQTKKMQVPHK